MLLSEIKRAPRNAKGHSEELKRSIKRWGYVDPMILDERTGRLVAGHGRLEELLEAMAASKPPPEGILVDKRGWLAPVYRGWTSSNDKEAEGFLLANNRLTEVGGWNEGVLAEMLADLGPDLAGTGWTEEEVAELLRASDAGGGVVVPREQLDDVPDVAPEEVRVRVGDLFELGRHRLLCGDAINAAHVARLMEGRLAQMGFTDPPWNVAYGQDSKPSFAGRSDRAILNDDMGREFPAFLRAACSGLAGVLDPGGLLYCVMGTQEWPAIQAALAESFHWSSTIIWVKDQFVLGRKDYHSRFEPIWYGWRRGAARRVPLEDRTQDDVWELPRPRQSEQHPMMKPVELVERALKNSSRPGDIVVDFFAGSGTALIAAETTGRRARVMELDPLHAQRIIARWEKATGQRTQLVGSESALPG